MSTGLQKSQDDKRAFNKPWKNAFLRYIPHTSYSEQPDIEFVKKKLQIKIPTFLNFTRNIFGKKMRMEDALLIYLNRLSVFSSQRQTNSRYFVKSYKPH